MGHRSKRRFSWLFSYLRYGRAAAGRGDAPADATESDSPSSPPVRAPQVLPRPLWQMLLAALLLGAGIVLTALYALAPNKSAPQLPKNAMLLGSSLELNSQAAKVGLSRIRQFTQGLLTLELPKDVVTSKDKEATHPRVSFAELGVAIDKSRFVQLLRDSLDASSALSQYRATTGPPDATLSLPTPLQLDVTKTTRVLMALKNEYDRTAVEARLDLGGRKVLPSEDGLLLEVDASLVAIREGLEAGRSRVPLIFERIRPQRTTDQLSNVAFDHVLASFETSYDRSMRSKARTHNLRIAAAKLDGTVLLPGEEFDFNRVVGPRDESNGYQVAPVIAQGELVDGIGGGTCQISGTLHGAAFFAGLDMVERYPHTRPSSYIKLGLDATVVYPTINFRFKNPHEFPVVLHQTVKNGTVRAEILGPKADRTVTLIRRITDASPYEQVERPDPALKAGQRLLAQRGVAGFTVRMYRIVRDGPHAVRERWDTKYPPTTQIIRVGTGPGGARQARGDSHPEYTADELLVVTQTPDPAAGEPKIFEDREPGRFGVSGWTEKAGMPYFVD